MGLSAELEEVAHSGVADLRWDDEMRVRLIGQVRRVWASHGTKVVQVIEDRQEWKYPNLAVNGLTGELLWDWAKNTKDDPIAPVVTK